MPVRRAGPVEMTRWGAIPKSAGTGHNPPRFYFIVRNKWAASHGLTPQQAARDEQFKLRYNSVRYVWRQRTKGHPVDDKSPHGYYANLLVSLGMRPASADYPPGESPTV
jgi:hypothetical protein